MSGSYSLPEHIYEDHIDHRTYNMTEQEAREIGEQNDLYLQPIYTIDKKDHLIVTSIIRQSD